jgi:type VI secretion system protein ImpI
LSNGLKLRITNTVNNSCVDRTFTRFPVRIGRSTLNDLNILDRFVSQFHAVVELHGDELMLRDLGSSNGTKVGSARAPAHEPTPLAPHKNAFGIGPLVIEARIVEVAEEEEEEEPAPQTLGPAALNAEGEEESVLENSFITNINQTLAFDAGGNAEIAAVRAKLEQALKSEAEAAGRPPERPKPKLDGTLLLHGDAANLQRMGKTGQPLPGQPQQAQPQPSPAEAKQRRLEQIALQGVREIARALLPKAPPLDEPEDLVRFLSKVRDTIEVFLRCFIPLREGYRQFASQMQIQRGGAGSIESATDERELAVHLLDWSVRGGEAHRAVEGTFADLMIHQLALLHALMRGVKSLLDALSPKALDLAFEELEKQGKTNFSWGPWRFKELWRLYNAKHGDVDDGDKRMFSALFGPDFAESYKQYRATIDTPESSA